MIAKPTTWGDVWQFGYVVDKAGVDWKITQEKAGWVELKNRQGEIRQMQRPHPDTPVTALLMEEPEVIGVIRRVFPGAELIEIKED